MTCFVGHPVYSKTFGFNLCTNLMVQVVYGAAGQQILFFDGTQRFISVFTKVDHWTLSCESILVRVWTTHLHLDQLFLQDSI